MTQPFQAQYARLGINDALPTDLIQKAQRIYEAACRKLGVNPEDMPDVSRVREKYRGPQLANHKLMIIRDAITDDREADYDNREEKKWGGWFWLDNPGFRFGGSDDVIPGTDAASGSRLCTFSEEDQQFFMQECIAIWAAYHGHPLPE